MNARFLTALAFAGLCLAASVNAAPAGNFLIVPGHSIGQTALGPNGAAELSHLPKPAAEDSGMMQSSRVWVSKTSGHTDTLFVHTVANAAMGDTPVKPTDGVTINAIRITSRQFHIQSGISTASTLAQVRRRFPDAHANHFTPQIYDDARHGISFEFAQPVRPASRCIGIVVYPPSSRSGSAETTQNQVDDLLKNSHA